VFVEWNGRDGEPRRLADSPSRSVISPDGWRLTLSAADKSELYHLAEDPLEATNFFYSGRHADVIRRLTDQIRRWQEQTGDTVALPMSF
jgi:hypothetical protein